MNQNPRFHHAGYIVPSIADSVAEFQNSFSLEWDGQIVHDPLQMVRVTFLPSNAGQEGIIELVEPAGPRSPVKKFAEAGGGLHHVCYEINDLQAQLSSSVASGCILVRVPMRAAAFAGRHIAWVKTPSNQLIEFLQRP